MSKKHTVHSEDEQENIDLALYEALWISRWKGESLVAVLTVEEVQQMTKDIRVELDKIGYKISKK